MYAQPYYLTKIRQYIFHLCLFGLMNSLKLKFCNYLDTDKLIKMLEKRARVKQPLSISYIPFTESMLPEYYLV